MTFFYKFLQKVCDKLNPETELEPEPELEPQFVISAPRLHNTAFGAFWILPSTSEYVLLSEINACRIKLKVNFFLQKISPILEIRLICAVYIKLLVIFK